MSNQTRVLCDFVKSEISLPFFRFIRQKKPRKYVGRFYLQRKREWERDWAIYRRMQIYFRESKPFSVFTLDVISDTDSEKSKSTSNIDYDDSNQARLQSYFEANSK